MRAKGQSESALRASGIGYTILAPTAFMEVWPAMVVGMPALQGRPVTLVGEGSRLHSFVSNRDVAAFALMVGVPGRQVGWMSRHGERLQLPVTGAGEATCPHTGDRYVLRDGVCRLL